MAITQVLSATLAVSVALPLAWLPSYWLGVGGRAAALGPPKPAQLVGASVAAVLGALPAALALNTPMPLEWLAVMYAAWVPLLVVGVPAAGWLAGAVARVAGGAARASAAAPRGAARVYWLLAGLLLLHHVNVVIAFAAVGAPWQDVSEVFALKGEPLWQAAYFLVLDCWALVVGMTAFVGMEAGVGAAAAYLAGAALVGPGTALALFLGAREEGQMELHDAASGAKKEL